MARLLREAEQRAVELIRSHRPELEQLVDLLLEKETVDGSAVYRIVGKPVPGHTAHGDGDRPARRANRTGSGQRWLREPR